MEKQVLNVDVEAENVGSEFAANASSEQGNLQK